MNYKKRRCRRYPKHACSCGGKSGKRDGNAMSEFGKHDHAPLAALPEADPSPVRAVPKFKKDRKRWCGGHVGREHQYRWQPHSYLHTDGVTPKWWEQKCDKCKRQGNLCSGSRWRRSGPYPRGPEYFCICGQHTEVEFERRRRRAARISAKYGLPAAL